MANNAVGVPEGCTFLNSDTLISNRAHELVRELLDQADKRDPDANDMYIYNDFFGYAILDLVHDTLSKIHTKVVKKEYHDAFYLLEALAVFNDMYSVWPQVDDGELVSATNVAYGGLVVATLKHLDDAGQLTPAHLPSLETMLRLTSAFGRAMAGQGGESSGYHRVCNGIGARLFAFRDKAVDPAGWADARARDEARVKAWIASLPAERRTSLEARIAAMEREREEERAELDDAERAEDDARENAPWFRGIKDRQDGYKGNFAITRTWKEYRDAVRGAPNAPMRGPPEWDLSQWSDAEKAPFKFGADDELD